MSDQPRIRPGFLFSQHSLGTFARCPRRFLLKYVDRLPWPVPEDEDPLGYQRHLERGRVFHQWMVRQQLGIDMSEMAAACGDPMLETWWQAAQTFDWRTLPSDVREPEMAMVVPIGAYRLYARYDLVALNRGGRAVIVDWKTLGTRPSERILRTRLQTRIYLYTLVTSGGLITGGLPIDPSDTHMLYWFTEFPGDPSDVSYSADEHRQAEHDLRVLVQDIASREREAFARTSDPKLCARCNYRSLCDRAETPGKVPPDASAPSDGWLDEDIDFALDLDTVDDLDY